MEPAQMAYDRGITVFSPDGRLFQVEYAREAVKKGNTTIGLKFKDGVILIVDKHVSSKLMEPSSSEKIYRIDEYIGCATSGLVADARILVDEARRRAQEHKITYNENISVVSLVKRICDMKQYYTQSAGGRPFGTALLFAGVDDIGIHLYETDPSGAMVSYKASCIGTGRQVVMEMLEKEYKENLSFDDAVKLGIKALALATDDKLSAEAVEIGCAKVGKSFKKLEAKEIEAYFKKH